MEPNSSEALRRRRKKDHLRLALTLPDGPGPTGFADVDLLPEALPDLDLNTVDISTTFCGLRFRAPILINAMTGGTPEAARLNARLAEVAKETGVPMAVGSQRVALRYPALAYTFTIVRRVYPRGVLFANLGAGSTPAEARAAVEMLEAQGLQLHLNAAQELSMREGDRSFRWSESIKAVAAALPVPVVAKEVGCGISGQTARHLFALGVKAVDVGGKGGTNFIAIEERRGLRRSTPFLNWGLPTAWSLLDVLATAPQGEVCASGGIRTGLDMAKALALGARICGVARPLLRAIHSGGTKAGIALIRRWEKELKAALALAGAKSLAELTERQLIFCGDTWNFITQRQLDRFLKRAHA